MAEKGERKKLVIFTICIIILSISFSGCINNSTQKNYSFKYEVNFSTNDNSLNIIFIPILINQYTWNISKAMDYIKIEGNYTYKYIDTLHGKMLNISGKGSFHILAKENKKIPFAILNSLVDLDNDGVTTDEGGKNCKYWIYFNAINKNESISLKIHSSVKSPTSGVSCKLTYNGSIKNNWIMTNGSQVHMEE